MFYFHLPLCRLHVTGDLSAGAGVHIPLYTGDAAPTRPGPNQVRDT